MNVAKEKAPQNYLHKKPLFRCFYKYPLHSCPHPLTVYVFLLGKHKFSQKRQKKAVDCTTCVSFVQQNSPNEWNNVQTVTIEIINEKSWNMS